MADQKIFLLRKALEALEASDATFDEAILETLRVSSALGAISMGSSAVASYLRRLADDIETDLPDGAPH